MYFYPFYAIYIFLKQLIGQSIIGSKQTGRSFESKEKSIRESIIGDEQMKKMKNERTNEPL